jgi:hypothetical protein
MRQRSVAFTEEQRKLERKRLERGQADEKENYRLSVSARSSVKVARSYSEMEFTLK